MDQPAVTWKYKKSRPFHRLEDIALPVAFPECKTGCESCRIADHLPPAARL
jgi:hypothetical protein